MKNMNCAFTKLKDNNGEGIKILLAVPRSNSTLVEFVLASSDSVSEVVHEPFLQYGYYKEPIDTAYEIINGTLREVVKGSSILIKDMVQWVTYLNEHEQYLRLISEPVGIIVKNPLLNIESKIKCILKSAPQSNRPGLSIKLNLCSCKGDGVKECTHRVDFNTFAQKYGYASWDILLQERNSGKEELICVEPILEYFEAVGTDIWGWKSLEQIVLFLRKNNKQFFVLDGTDFCLMPTLATKALCSVMHFVCNENILDSNNRLRVQKKLELAQPKGQSWYSVELTKDITIPKEKPRQLAHFSKNIQKYMTEVAIPTYLSIVSSTERLRISDYGTEKESKVFKENQKKYKRIDSYYHE